MSSNLFFPIILILEVVKNRGHKKCGCQSMGSIERALTYVPLERLIHRSQLTDHGAEYSNALLNYFRMMFIRPPGQREYWPFYNLLIDVVLNW